MTENTECYLSKACPQSVCNCNWRHLRLERSFYQRLFCISGQIWLYTYWFAFSSKELSRKTTTTTESTSSNWKHQVIKIIHILKDFLGSCGLTLNDSNIIVRMHHSWFIFLSHNVQSFFPIFKCIAWLYHIASISFHPFLFYTWWVLRHNNIGWNFKNRCNICNCLSVVSWGMSAYRTNIF